MTRRAIPLAVALAAGVVALTSAGAGQGAGVGQAGTTVPPQTQTPPVSQIAGQPSAPATGVISGIVIDAATNAPIPDASVFLGGRPPSASLTQQDRQLTDSKGRFVFTGLAAADAYYVASTKFGYLDGGFNTSGPWGTSSNLIALREGEWFSTARISMWKPGAIAGTVVDERGEPVVNVYVRVLPHVRISGRWQVVAGPLTRTDDRGMYRIAGLPPGKYVVQVPSVQASVPAVPVPIPIEQTEPNAAPRTRVVQIENALDGDPGARLVAGFFPTPPPRSDGRSLVYPITFYPAAIALSQATTIDLEAGEERSAIDVRIEPVAASRIAGSVEGPAEALAGLTLRLLPAGLEELGLGSEAATALVAADGTFMFLGVPAGTYTLDAPITLHELSFGRTGSFDGQFFPPPPGTIPSYGEYGPVDSVPGLSYFTQSFRGGLMNTRYWARTSVTVRGGSESNVALTMRPSVMMSGRTIAEADPNRPGPATPWQFPVSLDAANGSASLGRPRRAFLPDLPPTEFEIVGLLPGEYFLRGVGPGWLVKSITWNGRSYLDRPFDAAAGQDFSGVVVTFTNAVPTTSGTVRDGQGAVAAGATVVAFPADRALWTNYGLAPTRISSAAASNTGGYRLSTLPAGDYLLIALADTQAGALQDPEFFQKAESLATRVTIVWGDKKTVDLKVVEVR